MVTTVLLATRAPVVFAPAMNVQMWENPLVQQNLARLRALGYHFAEPESGELACGWEGRGRLASLESIAAAVRQALKGGGALGGRRVVVTAGPTEEALDPVRVLTNRSSGKMGYALAAALKDAGADVTLISGPTALLPPADVAFVPIVSTADLAKALKAALPKADALVMAAAVADFRPRRVAAQKLKRRAAGLTLDLVPNPDLLKTLARPKGLKVVGFALETARELPAARAKLRAKNCDLLVLNNPTRPGSHLGGDTNQVTILDRAGKAERLPVLAKRVVAERIVTRLAALWGKPTRGRG
jgi:phosphopantothenoylcysteine decarboxylase/phosphopantothenate--cysteine ligase